MFNPNENLKEQLDLADTILNKDRYCDRSDYDSLYCFAQKLAELVKEMHKELSNYCELPDDWKNSNREPPLSIACAYGIPMEMMEPCYKVILNSVGTNKLTTIKILREICNLSLNEAFAAANNLPYIINDDTSKYEAKQIQVLFSAAGAVVEVICY